MELETINVLITGIAGNSYGSQVAKCLNLKPEYVIYGADCVRCSPSYTLFKETALLPKANEDLYLEKLISFCETHQIRFLFEGSEVEMRKLDEHRETLRKSGIQWVANTSNVISLCHDKIKLASCLREKGFHAPNTWHITSYNHLDVINEYPVILKPSNQSSGSSNVFIAQSREDVFHVCEFTRIPVSSFCIQEYVGCYDQEYTVGVLHNPHGKLIGSIALKRDLDASLSCRLTVKNETNKGDLGQKLAVSSGISQGLIANFPVIQKVCEYIALEIGSCGPLNIQGRWHLDNFHVFEINPRFSGTSYMRALAGFNEPDIMIKQFLGHTVPVFLLEKPVLFRRILKEESWHNTNDK